MRTSIFRMIMVCCFLICNLKAHQFVATSHPLTPDVLAKLNYTSFSDSKVNPEDLRYVTIMHYGFKKPFVRDADNIHKGELLLHKDIAEDIIEIFKHLYEIKFSIETMHLIDLYEGNEMKALVANNTYAFASPSILDENTLKSIRFIHLDGFTIRINPKQNPYLEGKTIIPEGSAHFVDRSLRDEGMITPEIVQLFKSKGFEWGGECFSDVADFGLFRKKRDK